MVSQVLLTEIGFPVTNCATQNANEQSLATRVLLLADSVAQWTASRLAAREVVSPTLPCCPVRRDSLSS